MIEKIIHYCWFGNKKIPKKYKKYILTWKKYFPDYEIIEWNERNFPIDDYPFAKEAYESGKYAFVSDVARMHALYEYGGIYFDTDVEVIKSMDDLLLDNIDGIIGEESIDMKSFGTGFIALKKHHEISKMFLEYYDTHTFFNDNKVSTFPNTLILAKILKEKYSIIPDGKIKKIGNINIFPSNYFTCYNDYIGKYYITNESRCIHHFGNSWGNKIGIFIGKVRFIYHRIIIFFKKR